MGAIYTYLTQKKQKHGEVKILIRVIREGAGDVDFQAPQL